MRGVLLHRRRGWARSLAFDAATNADSAGGLAPPLFPVYSCPRLGIDKDREHRIGHADDRMDQRLPTELLQHVLEDARPAAPRPGALAGLTVKPFPIGERGVENIALQHFGTTTDRRRGDSGRLPNRFHEIGSGSHISS